MSHWTAFSPSFHVAPPGSAAIIFLEAILISLLVGKGLLHYVVRELGFVDERVG